MDHISISSLLSLLSDLLVILRLVVTIILKYFEQSNFLCTRATRTITNHALIEEYCLRFFSKESFTYSYSKYLIKTRNHITYKYRRFNNY